MDSNVLVDSNRKQELLEARLQPLPNSNLDLQAEVTEYSMEEKSSCEHVADLLDVTKSACEVIGNHVSIGNVCPISLSSTSNDAITDAILDTSSLSNQLCVRIESLNPLNKSMVTAVEDNVQDEYSPKVLGKVNCRRRRKTEKEESPSYKKLKIKQECHKIDEMFKIFGTSGPSELPSVAVQTHASVCKSAVSPAHSPNNSGTTSCESTHDCCTVQASQSSGKISGSTITQPIYTNATHLIGGQGEVQSTSMLLPKSAQTTSESKLDVSFTDVSRAVAELSRSNSLTESTEPGVLPLTNESSTCNHAHEQQVIDMLMMKIESQTKKMQEYQSEIESFKERQGRCRDVTKSLLIGKSELERKAARQKMTENKLNIGQFVPIRQGSHYEDKWIDGCKYVDLEKKRKEIETEREEIERKKKQWNKYKPVTDKSRNKKKSDDIQEVHPNQFFEQAEIYDLRKNMLNKEDKDLQLEYDRLDRERNLHIREMKRIANEDASRFNEFPVMNDRYVLLSLLGKGGFSEVHKAFDLTEQRYVACKVHQLNPLWSKDKKDNYIKHALRENEIHKNLDHARIVKVFDVFNIDDDAFCTVLEYCEGNDLDFFLKQNKCIPERDAKSIICQVVSALRYLNQRKPPIIHYDLKPGNILLGSGHLSGEIKITDFGLSKIMTDELYSPDIGMDLTSQGAGTYWYLPPECFETGKEPPKISSKVDVWSVGVIFFQCLLGRKPFGHNMTQSDILHHNTILEAKSIDFTSNIKISDGAKDFIRRCCTYRKEDRPDVFQLSVDVYLKPKAQLKHNLDATILPGPSSVSLPSTSANAQLYGGNS